MAFWKWISLNGLCHATNIDIYNENLAEITNSWPSKNTHNAAWPQIKSYTNKVTITLLHLVQFQFLMWPSFITDDCMYVIYDLYHQDYSGIQQRKWVNKERTVSLYRRSHNRKGQLMNVLSKTKSTNINSKVSLDKLVVCCPWFEFNDFCL